MTASLRMAYAFRRAAAPLASYYAVTLALPLASGAAASGARFLDHALIVLVVPPIAIAVACSLGQLSRACARCLSLGPAIEAGVRRNKDSLSENSRRPRCVMPCKIVPLGRRYGNWREGSVYRSDCEGKE